MEYEELYDRICTNRNIQRPNASVYKMKVRGNHVFFEREEPTCGKMDGKTTAYIDLCCLDDLPIVAEQMSFLAKDLEGRFVYLTNNIRVVMSTSPDKIESIQMRTYSDSPWAELDNSTPMYQVAMKMFEMGKTCHSR